MKGFFNSFLEKFGDFNFAEINNICMCDFERYFRKHFSEKIEIRNNYYKFLNSAEIENKMLIDFGESFFNIL
ncbi:MAG: hypothetical protein ACFFAH_15085 [Promethearchaeota archaeon]